MKVRFVAAVLAALLASLPAGATTYNYLGNPYTSNDNPAEFGSNLTGTVTFNFDTTAFTGTIPFGDSAITNAQLVSGIYSFSGTTNSTFNFTSGVITSWSVAENVGLVLLTTSNMPPFTNVFDQAWNIAENFVAFNQFSPATWTIGPDPTPLPAALPLFATGLGALGLLGWRRKRKNATTV